MSSAEFLEFLEKYVPPTSPHLVSTVMEESTQQAKRILGKARRIILSPILNTPNEALKTVKDRSKFILTPVEVSPPVIPPQTAQEVTRLVNHVLTRPQLLIAAVMKARASPSFGYIVRNLLPCLFGFFASSEHVEKAARFYKETILSDSLEEGTPVFEIIKPFFQSHLLFPFFESVMNSFFERFIYDRKHNDVMVGLRSEELRTLIGQRNNLIPEVHKSLIGMILEKSTGAQVDGFLFDIIETFASLLLERAGHPEMTPFLVDVVSKMRKSPRIADSVQSAFSIGASCVSIPSLFQASGNHFIHFIISVMDVTTLLEITSQFDIPKSLRKLSFGELPATCVFGIRVFNTKHDSDIGLNPLIFDTSGVETFTMNPYFERFGHPDDPAVIEYCKAKKLNELKVNADLFELYLNYVMNLKRVEQWENMIDDCEYVMYHKYAIEKTPKLVTNNVESAMSVVTKVPCQPLRREQMIAILQSNLQQLIKSENSMLDMIVDHWMKMTDVKRRSCTYEIAPDSRRNAVFWQSVERLSGVDEAALSASLATVNNIVETMRVISTCESDFELSQLIEMSIHLSGSKKLPRFYVIAASFLTRSQLFRSLCTENELSNWLIFENVILKILYQDEALRQLLFDVIARLTTGMRTSRSVSNGLFRFWSNVRTFV